LLRLTRTIRHVAATISEKSLAAEAQSRAPIFAAQDKRRELELEKEEEKKKKEWKERKDKKHYYPTIIQNFLRRTLFSRR
jgi:hypothetical protein